MQFKYPELLWALFLLLIPIIIHLFQLRRFKKTPFTNVNFLKKVVAESRRSSTLKKWLLLATRLLLLAMLVLAFAQPFFAEKSALTEKETIIFLDDSYSMQARTENGTLLSTAVQELIKSIPEDNVFTLFTNDQVFRDVGLKDIQNDLLTLPHTQKQLQLHEIQLKANTLFSDRENIIKNLVLISDFQQRIASAAIDSSNMIQEHLVQLLPDQLENIALDTVFIADSTSENMELLAILSANVDTDNVPVSIFNGDKLIAKTAAVFGVDKKAQVSFTIANNEVIAGKIEISDTGLSYDNQLFFNINQKDKIKVLAIGEDEMDYLRRIFTEDEFQFSDFSLKNLNYSLLDSQNLIVVNGLESIPNSLQTALKSFVTNGGSLVVIPSINALLETYNNMLTNLFSSNYVQLVNVERNITNIAFDHPLYKKVFDKEVTNFQYPKVSQYFRIRTNAPKILSFQDNDAFLVGENGIYIFTASISGENSNFKNSPLIVPTMYNMGINSLKLPELYNTLGNNVYIDVPIALAKDNIVKVAKGDYEFIPQQQSFANKVTLSFSQNPREDGIYSIKDGENIIRNISFNHNRKESKLAYLDLENLDATTKQSSIASLFQAMEKENSVTELWKWFVILALLFILVEVLIQKLLK